MNQSPPLSSHSVAIQHMITIGQRADRRGWVPAGGGNFSHRLDESTLLITTSGHHKGRLQADDFMRMKTDGEIIDTDCKPSDEAGLHAALYKRFPEAGAVLHMHTPYALALSQDWKGTIVFQQQELLKVFHGLNTHATRLPIPVIENDQDIPSLAEVANAALDDNPGARSYFVRGHGLYTWAPDLERAERQVEGLEFLCQCEVLRRSIKSEA